MRVLMLTPLVPDPAGVTGGAIVMHGALAQLARRHDVTLATLASESAADAAALQALSDSGVDVHAVRIWRGGGARGALRKCRFAVRWLAAKQPLRNLAFHFPAVQRLLDELAVRAYDLIQVEDVAMGAYRLPPATARVLTEHEVRAFEDAPARVGALARFDQRRWNAAQPSIWARFPIVQVFCASDAANAVRLAPTIGDRLRINPIGIDVPAGLRPGGEDAATLLFVGNFAHPPNVEAALRLGTAILPRIRAAFPDVRLEIVGAGPPAAVRALSETPGVIVTGTVPDVGEHLRKATVVVVPISTGGGMRVKVLEALAHGRPVVATSLAAAGLDERAPVCRVDADEEIAAAAIRLLADPAERGHLFERGRSYVRERHSWDAFGERLAAIHDEARHGTQP